MQDLHLKLWQRLETFELDDPGSAFPFSSRLAREQGWTHAEAARAIGEYRRFLFLAAVAGHPVSPPSAVDHAWHLHLLYTRSYWQDLCRDTLGFELHHEPTRGGSSETEKFTDWYARTLQSYQTHFGHESPADIWPRPGSAGSNPAAKRWVDTARHWVVPKNPLSRKNSNPFA